MYLQQVEHQTGQEKKRTKELAQTEQRVWKGE